ncbi:MAG: hypothetical protein KJ569_02905, partial [Candidatus Omnitrophica bacterium]|nr:hypothetical protein [Candidatus Omnitrophota bacterium]
MIKELKMKRIRWFVGAIILGGIIGLIIIRPFPFLFYPGLPYLGFTGRALYILILACFLCLYRIYRGPTAADRIV